MAIFEDRAKIAGKVTRAIPSSHVWKRFQANFFGRKMFSVFSTLVLIFGGFLVFSNAFDLKVQALPLNISASTGPNVLVGLNQTGVWPNAGTVGSTTVDLHGTVIAIDPGVVVAMVSNGDDPQLQVDSGGFGYGGTSAGSVTVRWEIFEAGSTTNQVSGEPSWSVLDIDGSGSAGTIETVRPDMSGLLSYDVSTSTALDVQSVDGQLVVSGTDEIGAANRDSAAVTFDWGERFSWDITYTNHLSANGRVFDHDGDGDFTFAGGTTTTLIPQVDLDGNDDTTGEAGGTNYLGFHVNNNVAVPVSDSSDTVISNVSGNVDGLIVELTNPEAGDVMTIDGEAGTSGTVSGTSIGFNISGGLVTFSGSDTVANYVIALEAVRFNTTVGTTSLGDRTFETQATVSGLGGNIANSTISFTQDTDGDLVPDAYEVVQGTNVSDPLDYLDDDGDLVPNYIEDQDGTSNSDINDFTDEDGGGTPDYVEVTRYTNEGIPTTDPNTGNAGDDAQDTDGDGTGDYDELKAGTNPLATVIITTTGGSVDLGEDGTTDTIDYELMSEPAGDVTVTLDANPDYDYGAGFNTAVTLTFTSADWDTPQTVTVIAADNDVDEDSATYTGSDITYTVASTGDTDYDGIPVPATTTTITNDDAAGVDVDNAAGISITEDGANGSFDVALESEPISDVIIDISSSDTGAATVGTSQLTFTSNDWDTPQSLSISPVSDPDLVDEIVTITFSVNDAGSDDVYDPLSDITRTVTVSDDDSAGFTVTPTSGGILINEGQTLPDTISVVLDAQPQSDVVIDIASPDTSALIVDTPSVIFTSADWDTPQDVSISAPEDPDFDNENDLLLNFSINNSGSDDDFDALADQGREVDVLDNEIAGFTITPTSGGLSINEGDTEEDYYSVVLDAQPINDVVIDITSSDSDAATTDVSSLTFTNSNWDTPQTVDVIAPQDDDLVNNLDNIITFSINDGSSDDNFDALADQGREVDVLDDDGATIVVSPTGITVNENAGTNTFTVVLGAQPQSDVVIDLSSVDTGEGTVSPATLTFTDSNWDTPQTVTVTGVDDDVDRDDTVDITVSVNDAGSDDDFDGVGDETVNVTLTDDDTAGFTMNSSVSLGEGSTDSFSVVLDSQPESNVVIDLNSDDIGAASLSTNTLTFTPSNWDTPQTVTITGEQDDNVVDESVIVTASINDAGSDDTYDSVSDGTVAVTVNDDDVADIVVSPTGITVNENAGSDTFTVVLSQQPTSDVVIDLTSGDTDEATVSPATLTFTPSNWDQPQTVTITGVNDVNISDDTTDITVSVNDAGSDDDWDGVSDIVTVDLTDNDVDTDGDLVPDEQEVLDSTDVNDPANYNDADGDLVPDYVETELQELEGGSDTDENDPNDYVDTDGGSVPNYVETVLFPNIGLNTTNENDINDDSQDTDGDLVTDYNELLQSSDPEDNNDYLDSDGDLVPDDVENGNSDENDSLDYVDTDGDLVPDYVEETLEPNQGLNSTNVSDSTNFNDTDGDLVPDYVESIYQSNNGGSATDPNDALDVVDTDGGGLPDYTEETYMPNLGVNSFDPNNAGDDNVDTDGDGVPDIVELTDSTATDPTNIYDNNDSDGDGHPDYVENQDGSDPNDPNSLSTDTDGDGVPDVVETTLGSDPNDNLSTPADTDGDGHPDYVEMISGSDAGDNGSVPVDTDGDLVPDSVEQLQGSDINDATNFGDGDGDLVPSYVETQEGTNSDDNTDFSDDDGSGTPNYVETNLFPAYGAPATDPNDGSDDDTDTDNGQKPDYQELLDGSDIFDITDDTDADVDNVPDTVEQGAPNNGDGNGDGIPDYVQSNVSSNINSVTGSYTTLAVGGDCSDITNFEFVTEASLPVQDEDSIFEIGLHNFAVDCGANGATAEITVYWDQAYDTSAWSYRKFNPNTNVYSDITDQVTNTNELVGANTITVSRYNVTDGGPLDIDGVANGQVVDPAGPTVVDPQATLLRTGGTSSSQRIQIILLIVLAAAFITWFRLGSKTKSRIYNK